MNKLDVIDYKLYTTPGTYELDLTNYSQLTNNRQRKEFLINLFENIENTGLIVMYKSFDIHTNKCSFDTVLQSSFTHHYLHSDDCLNLYCSLVGVDKYVGVTLEENQKSHDYVWICTEYCDLVKEIELRGFKTIRFRSTTIGFTKLMIKNLTDILNKYSLDYEFIQLPNKKLIKPNADYQVVRRSHTRDILAQI